jgi:hypothetical protein
MAAAFETVAKVVVNIKAKMKALAIVAIRTRRVYPALGFILSWNPKFVKKPYIVH